MLPLYQCPSIIKPIWAIREPGYTFCHAYEFTLRPFISVGKFETVQYIKVKLRDQPIRRPIKCQDVYSQGVTYLTANSVWCDGVSILLNGIRTHCIQCNIRRLKVILSLSSKGHINFCFHQNMVKQLADISVYSWLVFFQKHMGTNDFISLFLTKIFSIFGTISCNKILYKNITLF